MKIKGIHCKSRWSKARGLMFSKRKTLIFHVGEEKQVGLHMFFVFFQIYVYFLDSKQKVVEIAHLYPWTWYKSREKATYVVESCRKLDLSVGEKVTFISSKH